MKDLSNDQCRQLSEMRAANQRLFRLGAFLMGFVVMVGVLLWMNQSWVDNFMGDGGPWGRPALQSLAAIQPETAREASILEIFRGVIPLPIVAVKNSFIYSTLIWLFMVSLMIISFARRQKKNLEFLEGVMKK